MTEQMTGRKEPEGTERPPGAAAGPSAPSPRDLAARSPHHPAARDAQPRPAEAPHAAPPQAAGSVPPTVPLLVDRSGDHRGLST